MAERTRHPGRRGPAWRHGALALGLVLLAPPAMAQTSVQAIFDTLDENGDGEISREEFQRNKTLLFFEALGSNPEDQPIGPDQLNIRPEVFAEADMDGDGMLSGAEFVQARFTQFEAIDANDDLVITFDELSDFLELYRQ